MSAFFSIRSGPYLRRYFDAVHPFFWPVFYWRLKQAWLFLQREKRTSVLLAVTWWRSVGIVWLGDRLQPPDPQPPRTDKASMGRSRLVQRCVGCLGKPRGGQDAAALSYPPWRSGRRWQPASRADGGGAPALQNTS